MELSIEKNIRISLQHREELDRALDFNKENNFEYGIKVQNNLVDLQLIMVLIKCGYKLVSSLNSEYYVFKKENK